MKVETPVRLRTAERSQVDWRPLAIDQLIPKDHWVRLVWAHILTLDVSSLHADIAAREGQPGRNATDPRILLCLWIAALVEGDLRVQQRLTLKDALLGCKREVVLRIPTRCDDCAGTGAKPGTKRKPCTSCGGMGQVLTSRGFVMFTQTCPDCGGEGSVVKTPCASCNGAGAVEKTRKIVVTFPAGIDTPAHLGLTYDRP